MLGDLILFLIQTTLIVVALGYAIRGGRWDIAAFLMTVVLLIDNGQRDRKQR